MSEVSASRYYTYVVSWDRDRRLLLHGVAPFRAPRLLDAEGLESRRRTLTLQENINEQQKGFHTH